MSPSLALYRISLERKLYVAYSCKHYTTEILLGDGKYGFARAERISYFLSVWQEVDP
jgi:hypothetical protein